MQKIIQSQTHSKTQDMQRDYYLNQKKTLEINPRHPLIKELLRRVEDNPADATAKEMAVMMFNTATLRWVSGVWFPVAAALSSPQFTWLMLRHLATLLLSLFHLSRPRLCPGCT